MHLRVQDVSNFLAVGGLGSGSVRLSHYRGVDVHLRAEASISRFVFRHGVAAVPKTPIPRASAGPENTQLRTAQIVNSGRAEIYRLWGAVSLHRHGMTPGRTMNGSLFSS